MRIFLLLTFIATAAHADERRIAVLVGANGAVDGRQALRFAESDAEQMAQVLEQVGHFLPEDVLVAKNPTPNELWALLDAASEKMRGASDGLIFFYFSGHADDKSIYLHGLPASVETLRHKLEASGAQIRIGFLDACFGGAWTRSKGLSVRAPFVVQMPIDTGAAGSVLISSSTGDESAHESDALLGSFFTHHFIAGLRGAADLSGDGDITLAEAFDYAKTLTIRDTSEQAPSPQHPSFDINLRGRRDIIIAQLANGPTTLQVSEVRGPLQLIHLQSGLVVLEIEPGKRHVTLAVPAGHYVLRRATDDGNYAREIGLAPGQTMTIDEADLQLITTERLALKRPDTLPTYTSSTLQKGKWEIDAGFSIETPTRFQLSLTSIPISVSPSTELSFHAPVYYGITDRLQYKVGTALFAYRFGHRGGIEFIPYGGIDTWGYAGADAHDHGVFRFPLVAGADARFWIGQKQSFVLGAHATSDFYLSRSSFVTTPSASLALAYTLTIKNLVTINPAIALGITSLQQAGLGTFSIGGIKSIGGRSLPLIQIAVTKDFAVDFNGTLTAYAARYDAEAAFEVGFTFTF